MEQLIETEQLIALLARAESNVLLVHVASAEAYAAGHIEGAVHVAPGELVSGIKPATGTLPSLERLTELFARIGYRENQQIVVYDDEGGGWAGRFIWTLDVIGHANWRYLDGGIHAWAAAGAPISQRPTTLRPAPVNLTINHKPIAEAADILAHLDDGTLTVWDCRSAEEYEGTRVAAARAGHIPGAINLDWLELMDRTRQLRLRTDIEVLLRQRGITRDCAVVVHCQTHHRSSLAYLAARLLGFPRIRGYHGSWAEWGNRTDTPIETGA